MIRRPLRSTAALVALGVVTVLWAAFVAWLIVQAVRFGWGATFSGMMPWWFAAAWVMAAVAAVASLRVARWDEW